MQPIRVVLVDHHEVVRHGLRLLIETQPDLRVVGEAGDGLAALTLIPQLNPDVAIVDPGLPQMNGMELTTRLRALLSPSRILMLTAHESVAHARMSFQSGVTGYLVKRCGVEELLTAIRVVAKGERFMGSHLHGHAVDQWTGSDASDPAALSDREQAVLQLIAWGLTNKEIAAQLDVSIKSVETYKLRGMQKLNLSGRTDIVRYALRQKWLAPS